jgi:hypothetical protein
MEIGNSDLYAGVRMSLSAMSAHALLKTKGDSLNLF